jgi:polysaccharide biosynthesis/export protein
MSIQFPRMTGAKQMFGQRPGASALLVLAAVCGVASAQLSLKAQDSAQEQSVSAPAMPANATLPPIQSGDYLINPDDVLDVYVYGVPELSREYTVSAGGTITLPLLSQPVHAAGLTPDQFARSLEAKFRQAGRLSRPLITVSVKQSPRSMVIVEGAVKTPQAVPILGRTNLLTVLFQCGGPADDAGSTLTVTRGMLALHALAVEGMPAAPTSSVEFRRLMNVNDPASAVYVWPGDRVSVERAGVFYVMGEVIRPGEYNLKTAQEQVSVLQAVAIAGDLTPFAKKDKAMLIRKDLNAPNGRQEIALNLHAILIGRSPDRILQPNDILYVPSSGRKRAIHGLGTAGQTMASAAGAAIVYSRF